MHENVSGSPSQQKVFLIPRKNSTTYSERVEETVDELNARTTICGDCNAPARVLCHRIQWNGVIPRLVARKFHSRRLKDAIIVEERRQRLEAQARRDEEESQHEQDRLNAGAR